MSKKLRILFVGNSHTYTNLLPTIVKDLFACDGVDIEYDYQTHGGKGLDFHYENDSVEYLIKHGEYDYVILQGHGTRIDPATHLEYGKRICEEYIAKTSSKTVIYAVWPRSTRDDMWEVLEKTNANLAKETGAILAPAGSAWKKALETIPATDMYKNDCVHAKPEGSYLAAACIFYAITGRDEWLEVADCDRPHTRLGITAERARVYHKLALEATKKFRQ